MVADVLYTEVPGAEDSEPQSEASSRSVSRPTLEAQKFCHRSCVCRCCGLVLSFVMLAIAGTLVSSLADPLLGAAALSLGPSAIIITFFFHRYQSSTSPLQVAYTFCEAICWMLPLILLIAVVDYGNKRLFGRHMELACSWAPEAGGKVLVSALSYSAHCTREPFAAPGPPLRWDGLDCSETSLGEASLGNASHLEALAGQVGRNGSVLAPFVLALEEAAVNRTGGSKCADLEALGIDGADAVGQVDVHEIRRGSTSVRGNPKSSLAEAFDTLFRRAAHGGGGAGGCECRKTMYGDGALPPYDYCGPGGTCVLSGCSAAGEEGTCGAADTGDITMVLRFTQKTVLHSFIEAFFRAGFLEEFLKYLAVRRILFKDRTVDAGCLLVYGLAAAAGFATAENVQYTMMHGINVAYMRMVLSIPLHCCTGLIIGIHLGYRKFLGYHDCGALATLAMPVLIHGGYDFVLMLPTYVPIEPPVRLLIAIAIIAFSVVYCRYAWLRISGVCVVRVADLQGAGLVSRPQCCCCECDCCAALCVNQDPLLPAAGIPVAAAPAPAAADAVADTALSRSSSSSQVVRTLARTLTHELVPDAPTCQTREAVCHGCRNDVRMHVLYPSYCPFCGAKMGKLGA